MFAVWILSYMGTFMFGVFFTLAIVSVVTLDAVGLRERKLARMPAPRAEDRIVNVPTFTYTV